VRLWFYYLNVIFQFGIKGIPFRSNAVTEKLTALFLAVPVEFMNFENRATNQPAVVGI
jgi:hypothetical protein